MASITDCDQVYGPGSGHLHEKVGDNPYPYAECTWYVWQFYKDTQNVQLPGNMGNGADWVGNGHREQWPVTNSPQENAYVSWSAAKYPVFGHVAVVSAVDGSGGGFWVREMNFTYYADEHPELAGKIDCRHVTSMDGITGFVVPTGVQPGTGGQGGPQDILAALETPFTSIAKAINQAALLAEAEALTARSKVFSVMQMGAGGLVMLSGAGLGALSTLGAGDPGSGARTVARHARRLRSRPEPTAVAPSPSPGRALTAAERSWLARNSTFRT